MMNNSAKKLPRQARATGLKRMEAYTLTVSMGSGLTPPRGAAHAKPLITPQRHAWSNSHPPQALKVPCLELSVLQRNVHPQGLSRSHATSGISRTNLTALLERHASTCMYARRASNRTTQNQYILGQRLSSMPAPEWRKDM